MRIVLAALLASITSPSLAQTLTPEPWDSATEVEAERGSARIGLPGAQAKLARRYETGDGTERDPDLAADFWAAAAISNPSLGLPELRRMAAAGNTRSAMLLGRLLLADASPAVRLEGRRYLRQAGDKGSAEANFILGANLASSNSRADRREAFVRLVKAEKGKGRFASVARFLRERLKSIPVSPEGPLTMEVPLDWKARFARGEARRQKSFEAFSLSEKDFFKAEVHRPVVSARLSEFAEAAVNGNPVAQYVFARELVRYCVDAKRLDRAACEAAIDLNYQIDDTAFQTRFGGSPLGDSPRVVEIGKMLEAGVDGPPDPERARGLYEIAHNRGSDSQRAEVNYRLARLLELGLGGPVDKPRAAELLSTAAMKGHPEAGYAIALKEIAAGEYRGAGYYLANAADAGNAEAAFYFATLAAEGKITARRLEERIYKYFRQAAAAGNRKAFYGVGQSYWNGWGVPKDDRKAQEWWEKAARVGDPKAANDVANLYMRRKDYAGAIPWLRRAAKGGYPGSAATLDQVLAAGYRERSLGGFLMDVFDFVGDVGEGMLLAQQAQYEREQAEIRRSMMFYSMVRTSGGSSSTGQADSGGSGSGEGASSGDDFSGGSADFQGGSDGGAGSWDAGSGNYGAGAETTSDAGGYGAAGGYSSSTGSLSSSDPGEPSGSAWSEAGGTGSSSGGGYGASGAIIVSTEDADRRAELIREAEIASINAQLEAERKAAIAQADKEARELEAKREAEAAAARYSHCDSPDVVCVSPQ